MLTLGILLVLYYSSDTTATTITNGIITSPNFPNGIPSNVDKCWAMMPEDGQSIMLMFTHFQVRKLIILFLSINNKEYFC